MIEEIFNVLNNFQYCISVDQVGEDIKMILKQKSSGLKNNIMKWLIITIEQKYKNNQTNTKQKQKFIQFIKNISFQTIIENLLNDPAAQVRDSTIKFINKARCLFGQSLFKNIDKCINSKDIINKLNDRQSNDSVSKSKNKQISKGKKPRNTSKTKIKHEQQEQQLCTQKSYTIKPNSQTHQQLDISQQLSKHIKKLNDNSNWQNRKQSAQKLIKYLNKLHQDQPQKKIISTNLHQFLIILKNHIADPNKQLIKIFIQLIGSVFILLNQKQAKTQAKYFIFQLVEVFSDKNQIHKKQIFKTFDKISQSVGLQTLINYLAQYFNQQISNGNQCNSIVKQGIFQYLINNNQFANRIQQLQSDNLKQLKQYPKIIILGLCDKNKQCRTLSQKLLKIFTQKIGTQVFKSYINTKDLKSLIKCDLTPILDKLQSPTSNQQLSGLLNNSVLSQGKQPQILQKRYPSLNQSNKQQPINSQKFNLKNNNSTSLRNSCSKSKNNSILICQDSRQYSHGNLLIGKDQHNNNKKNVSGNQMFANVSTLTMERVSRQENVNRYRNNCNNHPILQQQQIRSALCRLVNYEQLYIKMYSNDYKKNLQVCQKLIKACRDVAQTNCIREISDLLLKWVIIKLYGGNIPMIGLIELVCPILIVLQKKKIAWTDFDIDILICLTKQYIVTCFYDGNINIQTIKTMYKLAVVLSSGQRILKKLLQQFKIDLGDQHRHTTSKKRQGITCSIYYKKYLCLICGFLIDYFSNDNLLLEASKIYQLVHDCQFIQLLKNKFHQGVIKQFGFSLQDGIIGNYQNKNHQKNCHFAQKQQKVHISRSGSPGVACFGVVSSKNQQKNHKKTPQKLTNQSTSNLESYFPTPTTLPRCHTSQPSPFPSVSSLQQIRKNHSIYEIYQNLGLVYANDKYQIDTSKFAQPNHHNPLSSNLQKLYPYNQSTVHFFSTIFQPQNQNSEKIVSQLTVHSNIIYSYLINALIKIMDPSLRQLMIPQKLITFLSLIQQGIKCQNIFKNINQQLIQKSMKFTIDQLVYQDQNKIYIENKFKQKGYHDFKGDCFIKGINGVMLRLLDNSMPLLLINILLLILMQTIIQVRTNEDNQSSLPIANKNKKLALIIRCIIRVTSTYFEGGNTKQKQLYNIDQDINCIKLSHIIKFLLSIKQFITLLDIKNLIQFDNNNQDKLQKYNYNGYNNQLSVITSILIILKILYKKNILINNFQYLKKQKSNFKQQHTITNYIYFLENYKKYQPKTQSSIPQQQYKPILSTQLDQQLKIIIQMLSKTKTFYQGIKQLKIYIQQNSGKFDYRNYFIKMNFDQCFIQRVGQQLDNIKKNPNQYSTKSLNPDIQGKLDRLKMKLQGINNNQHSSSICQKTLQKIDKITLQRGNYTQNNRGVVQNKTPKIRQLSNKSTQQSSTNHNDIKKRIQQMKNKVNMSTTNRIR